MGDQAKNKNDRPWASKKSLIKTVWIWRQILKKKIYLILLSTLLFSKIQYWCEICLNFLGWSWVEVWVKIFYRFVGSPFQILAYKIPMTLSAPVLERPSDGSIKYINPKSTQPNPNPTPTPIPTPTPTPTPNFYKSHRQKEIVNLLFGVANRY